MSDKELDELFRQKVEEADIPFVPGDWDKMKQKLQSPSPGHNGVPWYKNNLFRSLSAIILLGGAWLAWNFWDGSNNTEVQQQENQSSSSELIIAETEESGENTTSKNEIYSNYGNNNSENNTTGNLEGKNAASKQEARGARSTFHSRNKINNKKTVDPEFQNADAGAVTQQEVRNSPQNQMVLVNRAKRVVPDLFLQTPKLNSNGLQPMDTKGPREGTYNVPDKKKADYWQDDRWSLAGLLSPDVSALKINDLHGLGTSAGINVEYFLLPQWSITLGGLYSFKTYQGDEGYQTGYAPSPNGIKGDCWVLDVPLNVRFYAINNELDRWYISTGFSSYFMLRESYELEYSNGYSPYSSEVDVRNSNQHLLGIMNFSLGYERILTPKLSLQVEPYFKLPITEIGEGKVNLKSAGAFIGIKYRW
ncbi:hypothetical protein QWY93_00305 [Echinicola jeungdonensis]|uniref:Outer membrane protein beta-barrel domain-containing protein n=1 Tax=Echinicola jeungdonensis TaxID=709343 RepID=A0ABV5J0J1_9BACT|nr:hypothetical protein [Echinicola jeungdonensis]MDN3667782.1 hypothetical protein [Echinicola jeungdonensis]